VVTPALTTIAAPDVWYPALGASALVAGGLMFDMPSHLCLRYLGPGCARVFVSATGSVSSPNANQDISISIAHNNVVLSPSVASFHLQGANDRHANGVKTNVTLRTGDTVQIYVRNNGDTRSIRLDNLNMTAMGIQ